jgi:hypothetical protein
MNKKRHLLPKPKLTGVAMFLLGDWINVDADDALLRLVCLLLDRVDDRDELACEPGCDVFGTAIFA